MLIPNRAFLRSFKIEINIKILRLLLLKEILFLKKRCLKLQVKHIRFLRLDNTDIEDIIEKPILIIK